MQPPLPAPRSGPGPGPVDDVLHDADWAAEARSALACAGLLLGTSLGVEACAHGPTLPGTVGWIALAALLLVVLLPPRVGVAPNLLVVRGLWLTRTVRIDRLTLVSWPEGTARRLVLRDEEGARAEVDLRVLLANPALWLRIEAGARVSRQRGLLTRGTADLARLSLWVHGETTRSVFKVSGLE
ncbi:MULTISPECIES: hypothetical protein [unclassified Streptomyces]|uniref:hypothetical protein n=1 Tax=unclassified Streptomyces TaxID=2593676 RepID=UPI0006AF8751|nr:MULTISPECIES: hypothetical protein [unclassified Streptomyces]KOX22456.1 hypothetical protein ADL06_24285 [Streptomyces sp. NRRL F-6491]KOX38779.1 hypothetical protein ADL08_26930 [Streptomyces sp. NRRL F-6492]